MKILLRSKPASTAALAAAIFTTLVLSSCGGGGGNPGTCTGSAEVCASGTSGTGAGGLTPAPSTPDTSSTTSTMPDTATCSQFVTQTDAQAYFFSHAAPQLDPDGDGVACN